MSHLMWHHVTNTISQHVFIKNHLTYIRICRRSLQESPIMYQLNQIVIQIDRGIQNLPGSRVCPWRSHGILHLRRGIANTRILYVIRIKLRIIQRKVFCHDRILKTNSLERILPFFYTSPNVLFPTLRESIIHVKNNRFLRFYKLSHPVSRFIRWLQPPTLSVIYMFQSGIAIPKIRHSLIKYPDTRICHSRTHRLLRQKDKTTCHQRSKRKFIDIIIPLIPQIHLVTQRWLYTHVILKRFYLTQLGIILFKFFHNPSSSPSCRSISRERS